jgi:hypothetical protein
MESTTGSAKGVGFSIVDTKAWKVTVVVWITGGSKERKDRVGAGSQTVKKSTTAPRTVSVMTYSISDQKRLPRRSYWAIRVVVMEMVSSIPSLCKKRGSASHLSLNPYKKLAHVAHSVVYNLSTKFGNQSKLIDPFTAPTAFQLGTPEMIGSNLKMTRQSCNIWMLVQLKKALKDLRWYQAPLKTCLHILLDGHTLV